jgi:hypothetical protein
LQKNAANRGNVPLGHAVISQAQAEVAKAALTLWLVGVLTARKCFHSLVELLYQLRHPVGDFLAQQVRMERPQFRTNAGTRSIPASLR